MTTTQNSALVPLWLDVDTGHDDAFALLLAAHSPRTKILGVSTVHGNATLKHTTNNTLRVLEAIGRRDIPVYPGARKPLTRDAVHAQAIHGETGLDGVTLLPDAAASPIAEVNAVKAMYKSLKATAPGTAWLVTTGTMTNAGQLFIDHPDLAEHIAGVSVMGGALGNNFTEAPMGTVAGEGERFGNWTPYAEFNIYCDPEAAQIVFGNPILAAKTTLIPLDVTHLCLGTRNVRRRLLYGGGAERTLSPSISEGKPSAVRALFHQIMTFFAQTYADVFALTEGPPLHDPLAVIAAFEPDLFKDNAGERYKVEVVNEGAHTGKIIDTGELGRTIATLLPLGVPGIRIPRGLNVQIFWDRVEAVLHEAEKVSPLQPLDSIARREFDALYAAVTV